MLWNLHLRTSSQMQHSNPSFKRAAERPVCLEDSQVLIRAGKWRAVFLQEVENMKQFVSWNTSSRGRQRKVQQWKKKSERVNKQEGSVGQYRRNRIGKGTWWEHHDLRIILSCSLSVNPLNTFYSQPCVSVDIANHRSKIFGKGKISWSSKEENLNLQHAEFTLNPCKWNDV